MIKKLPNQKIADTKNKIHHFE